MSPMKPVRDKKEKSICHDQQFNNCRVKILQEENRFLRKEMIFSSKVEKNLQTYEKMKQFLTQFLDHCFKDLVYVVREKQFMENLFDIEFTETVDRSIFYIGKSADNSYSN